MRRFAFAAAVITAGVAVSGTVSAAPIDLTNPATSATIATILAQPGPDAGKFIVFDKLFVIKNFTPAVGSPDAFQAANVTVVGRDNGIDGAGFRLLGQWADVPGNADAFGFVFNYNVTVLPAYQALGYKITGVNLAFNGFASGPGSVASVDETIFQGASFVDNARVVAVDGPNDDLDDTRAVPETTTLNAIKDFKLFAPTPGGVATASFIEQTFRQVPTPGASLLLAAGLGVFARRRR